MANYAVNTIFGAKDRVSKAFTKMGGRAKNFGSRAEKAFKKASRSAGSFGNIVKGILGAQILRRGFQLLSEGVKNFVTQARMIEDATARFTPLMGSVERATKLVDALNKTAATTPHTFNEISNVASQLLPVMNGDIEKTIATFRMLGDTAGGNAQKLESITRGYTKAMLKGRPDMESLNMIAEAGVPIFSEMAKSMGITKEQLFELSKQGKLTTDDLTNTFKRMTSEGGIFFNGMKIASETFSGKLSTLKDNVNLTFAAIGSVALPILKDMIDFGIKTASSIREWVTANKELVQKGMKSLFNIFSKVGNILKIGVSLFLKIGQAVSPLFKIFSKSGNAVDGFADAIDQTMIMIRPLINMIFQAVDVIGELIAAFVEIGTEVGFFDSLGKLLGSTFKFVGAVFGNLFKIIKSLMPLIKLFMFVVGSIASVIIDAFSGVMDFLSGVADFLGGLYNTIIKPIVDAVISIGKFTGLIKEPGKKIEEGKGGPGKNIPQSMTEAPNKKEAEAKTYAFEGRLDITGAPEGSTFQQDNKSRKNIDIRLLGENP